MNKELFLPFKKKNTPDPQALRQMQRSKLTEIGAQLREYRVEQSICPERVAIFTMIRWPLLQAIEEGQLDELPEAIYTQGLIRRYADALGFNGEEMANTFPVRPSQLPATSQEKKQINIPQLQPIHLYLAYILLIICSVNGLSHLFNRSGIIESTLTNMDRERDKTIQTAMAKTKEAEALTHFVSQGASLNQKSMSLGKSDLSKAVKLNVIVKDESWVEIRIDGKTEFIGTLPKGAERTWEAKQELVFIAGNAGGVLISVNKGETQKLGEPGDVKEVVFTAAPPTNPRS